MSAPDLRDPAQLAAYRRELRGVASKVRWSGVGLAALFAFARAWYWRAIPAWLPAIVIIVAVVLMTCAIVIRTRFHARRMRGG